MLESNTTLLPPLAQTTRENFPVVFLKALPRMAIGLPTQYSMHCYYSTSLWYSNTTDKFQTPPLRRRVFAKNISILASLVLFFVTTYNRRTEQVLEQKPANNRNRPTTKMIDLNTQYSIPNTKCPSPESPHTSIICL